MRVINGVWVVQIDWKRINVFHSSGLQPIHPCINSHRSYINGLCLITCQALYNVMSWNVTHCAFTGSNKTPPTPSSPHRSHPIFSRHPSPSANCSSYANKREAMLISHYLSYPSLGHGVPWWWVTYEMEVVGVYVCVIWFWVFLISAW